MRRKLPTLETFESLLTKLEKELLKVEREGTGTERYARAVEAAAAGIEEMERLAGNELGTEEAEISYYRQVWPRFYSLYFYYIKVCAFEQKRGSAPMGGLSAVIGEEEEEVRVFFNEHGELWGYYKAGLRVVDVQFTRAYSRACIFHPLSQVPGMTIASHTAAWGLALERYLEFLKGQQLEVSDGGLVYEWAQGPAAAVQLIQGQVLTKAVLVNGIPATPSQLIAKFQKDFRVDLRDYNKLVYAGDTRKKDPAPFLSKMIQAIVGRKVGLRK